MNTAASEACSSSSTRQQRATITRQVSVTMHFSITTPIEEQSTTSIERREDIVRSDTDDIIDYASDDENYPELNHCYSRALHDADQDRHHEIDFDIPSQIQICVTPTHKTHISTIAISHNLDVRRRTTVCVSEPRPRRKIDAHAHLLHHHHGEPTHLTVQERDDVEDTTSFNVRDYREKPRLLTPNTAAAAAATTPKRANRRSSWLIPAEHPAKILWDVFTVVLSFANAYRTHLAIRDRQFTNSYFAKFCQVWFFCDLLLNFCTQHKFKGGLLENYQAVWARYLTTWFVIDLLSLFPGEALFVQPLVEAQKRRGFFAKSFFRTKGVINLSKVLRGHHVKWVQRTAHSTGLGVPRVLRIIIKYLPKYCMFLRNMRALVAFRVLRQVHWIRKAWHNVQWRRRIERERMVVRKRRSVFDDDTHSLTEAIEDEDWDDLGWPETASPINGGAKSRIDWSVYEQDEDDYDIGPY